MPAKNSASSPPALPMALPPPEAMRCSSIAALKPSSSTSSPCSARYRGRSQRAGRMLRKGQRRGDRQRWESGYHQEQTSWCHAARRADFANERYPFPPSARSGSPRCQIIQNSVAALRQFRIKVAIRLDHRFSNFCQERFGESDLCAEASRAAGDHARDIVTPNVARHNAIRNQEGRGPGMVTDDAIRREIRQHFFFGMTCEQA